jgi:hypothetical protein
MFSQMSETVRIPFSPPKEINPAVIEIAGFILIYLGFSMVCGYTGKCKNVSKRTNIFQSEQNFTNKNAN